MKKWIGILACSLLLAACGEEKQATTEQHQHHTGTFYTNEPLQLVSNEGQQLLTFPPVLAPTEVDGNHVVYELTAQQGQMAFVDDVMTNTYGYNGDFLGPIIQLKQGQHVTMKLTNELSEATTFHWHGLEVAGDARDGGPHAVIEPNTTEIITFDVNQQAATLWYHPHPMGYTAQQVYKGLAGLLYIEDENNEAHQLPSTYAVNDFPLILQDRTFVDGQIDYEQVANSAGTYGDTVMINGVVQPYLQAPREKVRLRILNGSNALTYNLKFTDDISFELIATDGGFLEAAVPLQELELGAGERAEILVDFTQVQGDTLALFNDEVTLLPIQLQGEATETTVATNILNEALDREQWLDVEPTKHITMEGMIENFLLNGQTFDADRIDFRQQQGVTEIWEIENILSDEGAMAHPFHIHGTQFTVVSVNNEAPDAHWQGLKDTITVQPMQKVRIAVTFPETGTYMFHCHILEHEDVGMMGQIEVYK